MNDDYSLLIRLVMMCKNNSLLITIYMNNDNLFIIDMFSYDI